MLVTMSFELSELMKYSPRAHQSTPSLGDHEAGLGYDKVRRSLPSRKQCSTEHRTRIKEGRNGCAAEGRSGVDCPS